MFDKLYGAGLSFETSSSSFTCSGNELLRWSSRNVLWTNVSSDFAMYWVRMTEGRSHAPKMKMPLLSIYSSQNQFQLLERKTFLVSSQETLRVRETHATLEIAKLVKTQWSLNWHTVVILICKQISSISFWQIRLWTMTVRPRPNFQMIVWILKPMIQRTRLID